MDPNAVAPDLESMLKRWAPTRERLLELLAYGESEPDGRFLHWRRVGLLAPPAGFSREQWWLAIKLARRPLLRRLPLKSGQGGLSYTLSPGLMEALLRVERSLSRSSSAGVPNLERTLVLRIRREEAACSARLAGSESEAARVGEALAQATGTSGRPLSPDLIERTFQTLAGGSEREAPSRRREFLEHLCGWFGEQLLEAPAGPGPRREGLHPLLAACALHYWLRVEAPFPRANGRLGRVLFYWALAHAGYPRAQMHSISRVIARAPSRYHRALENVQTDGRDLTYFFRYQLSVLEQALRDTESYSRYKQDRILKALERLDSGTDLNPRQLALLEHAHRNPSAVYTVQAHRACHGIVTQTARTDLLGLVQRGVLSQTRDGRRDVFQPVKRDPG